MVVTCGVLWRSSCRGTNSPCCGERERERERERVTAIVLAGIQQTYIASLSQLGCLVRVVEPKHSGRAQLDQIP